MNAPTSATARQQRDDVARSLQEDEDDEHDQQSARPALAISESPR